MCAHAPLDGPPKIVEEDRAQEEEGEEDQGQGPDPALPPHADPEGDAGEAVESYPLVAVMVVIVVVVEVVIIVVDGAPSGPDHRASEARAEPPRAADRGAEDTARDRCGLVAAATRRCCPPPSA